MGPIYTHPEQVRDAEKNRLANCKRGLPSVQKVGPGGRVALVGYGPSLRDTWEGLVGFGAIWTVSKAHDFVAERGVELTHHTDTDFREHKAAYNKRWQEKAQYMLATQIHPSYLDRVIGLRVSLFHIDLPFGGMFPPGYLRLPGAFDAGLMAARLAFALGYREQEWFGFDACFRGDTSHAGSHEGVKQEPLDVEIAGKPYRMSTLFLQQAVWAEKMLCKHPQLRVKIHGDGALRPFLLERGKHRPGQVC